MSVATSLGTRGNLRSLREPTESSQYHIDIILVPGIGTISPDKWSCTNQDWLAMLPGSGAGAHVFAYEYPSPFMGAKPSWESILMLGYDLLQHLSDIRLEGDFDPDQNKPILIVCHSLGGMIVKQTLCIANKQFPRYGPIVNSIAGVVFLSTPHRLGDRDTNLTHFRDILEATTGKTMKISTSSIKQEGSILFDLADRFEAIAFRTPLLSVYELRESKVGSNVLRTKYQQLVNRQFCSTHAPMEKVIGLNLNHHDSCLFTQSVDCEGLVDFNKFIYNIVYNASSLIALRFGDDEYDYATTTGYSPTASELPFKVEQLEINEWPSTRATEGTSNSGFEIIYPTLSNPETQKSLHLPCHLLNTHPVNEDFCGREDILETLATALLPSKNIVTASGTTLRQFALCGFGGLGKTEIAREFCRRNKDSFDAVFWVMADEIAKLDHDYQQISLTLGLEDASECKSQVVSREILKGWLSAPRNYRSSNSDEFVEAGNIGSEATWLLVFDNADDPMILADYWPQGGGSILITSRDPLSKSMFTHKIAGLDLKPLSTQDSLSLFTHLTSICNEPTDDNTAQQISNAFGGVPLAISQMASIIRRQDLTLAEFFELYADHEEHASLYKTKFDTNLVTYRHSISTVWAFDKLKQQTRQLLELISFLDPDVIGEELLAEISMSIMSNDSQVKRSHYIEARTDLLQSSLVHRDKQKQHISVHRIVQDAILATMDATKKRIIFDQLVQFLWSNWPSAMPAPSKEPELALPKSVGQRLHVGRWPICAKIYPHVLRLHQLWSTIAESLDSTGILFARLLNDAAWYQKERGRTERFDGFFDTARTICETSTHGDRDSLLADIYFCLGAIAMDASEFDTSRVHKEGSFDLVFNICKQLKIEDERLYLAYAERGISRIQDKRYQEGETDLKEALRMRKAFGNYIPRSGETNLSWALLAQGKLEECNALLLDSLGLREEALGKDDRESVRTGLMLGALGNLRAAQSQWDESFHYHQKALRHMNETVGERDFYTATAAHKVAQHLIRCGQDEEAIILINCALNIWSVDPRAHKNELSRTTFLKGKLLEKMGKSQKATIALKVACRLRREITKEDKDIVALRAEDFDDIVAFWAR